MKGIIFSITIAIIIIGGTIILFTRKSSDKTTESDMNNITIVDGTQIIEIKAKGGYQPRHSIAKANMPTILRFNTNGTFDCSASVRIARLNISQILPNSGTTDINLGVQPIGTLQGTCGMGMYPFEVEFQS